MKKYLFIPFLLLFSIANISAQQFSNENFIYTEAPQREIQAANYNTLLSSESVKSISYFDGLGRLKQTIGIGQGSTITNLLDWKNSWTIGSGGVGGFTQNGQTSENIRINALTPFGKTDKVWRCVNDAASDADGGWNTSNIAIDKSKSYQYAVWVKRTGGQNGTTYHGTQNVVNLDGTANGNPYFWAGNLPQLDTWYLMVGMIHPATYSGGYSGISGVYDTAGTKVINGTDFKWSTTTTDSYFRSYLYYATDVNVSQYFYAPIVQKREANQVNILGLIKGVEATDIVTPTEYDGFGRQDKEYLPYAASTGGLIQATALTDVLSYYNTPKYENTPNPFSQKLFEASPLNRVFKQAAPGNDWALNSGHEIKLDYQTNIEGEVKLFVGYSTDRLSDWGLFEPSINQPATYGVGQLYKTITKDENWVSGLDGTTEEFKDKEGHVVLKRTYNNQISHDTYYVYDQYGNLIYVLPPLANGAFDPTTLDNLCYRYKYDYRNRLVEKKLPGKDWESIVYDKLDRPILTQDANLQASNKWLFTKYDAFGRAVYTGEYNNTINRKVLQDLATNSVAVLSEQFQGATAIGDTSAYYSNAAFPNTNITLNTINYYDSYDFDVIGPTPVAVTSYGIVPITNAKGLGTGSKVRVLGTTKWITNVSYYDVKGRPIYNYNYNDYLSTTSTLKSDLDFVGKTKEITSAHTRASVTTTVVDTFEYDPMGRLLTQKQKINAQTEEVIVANTYDDLGQLVSKAVGGNINQSRLQNIDYTYNIRGWLKAINDVNAIGTDLFAFQMSYNAPTTATPLYNGNISQTFWKTANTDATIKNYDYSYDGLNRLTLAADNLGHYNENPTYDKNGNIKTLFRNGNTVLSTASFGAIDNLTYTYDAGNKLLKVEDTSGNIEGFKNGSTAATEYTYDTNGNMKTDANKGITAISYNYLNLPTQVSLAGGTINYVYDATGVKQRKIVGSTTTDYANGYQYENNVLQFFPTAEGYASNISGTFSYIYQYKDHLGNVRLSYKDVGTTTPSLQIVEESNYYPFGLKQQGYNTVVSSSGNSTAQKYKYNGKELQDELGLNMYDYGARNYDPALGRWMNIDPKAETSRRFSPYTYALNNPIYFIDPDGMQADDWIEHKNSDGKTTITYDADVKTKEQAEAKNYKGVTKVFEAGTAHNSDYSEVVNLAADGKYNVNNGPTMDIDDTSYTSQGGEYISKMKGSMDVIGDILPGLMQTGADRLTAAAIPVAATGAGAVLGAGMAEFGGLMGATGALLEQVNDIAEGNFSPEKFITKGIIETLSRKVGGSNSFGPMEQIVNDNVFNLMDNGLDAARDQNWKKK